MPGQAAIPSVRSKLLIKANAECLFANNLRWPRHRDEEMRNRASYLFSETADISDVVAHVRESLKNELGGLGAGTILGSAVEVLTREIVDRFQLNVPVLRVNDIQQLPNEEIDIDVSGAHNRVFVTPGPHYVKGTAVRIAVPFDGDPQLFRYPSSQFGVPVEGDVVGNTVVLSHYTEQPDADAVKRDFDARIGQINNTLEFLRGKTDEWNAGLPSLVQRYLEDRRAKLARDEDFTLGYPMAHPQNPSRPDVTSGDSARTRQRFDLFLSHASEDKEEIARPLYNALTAAGVSVWFDEAVLDLGDSLRQKIDEGLSRCRYGVVILSPTFFSKQWPQRELDGLVARETASGEKAILPIWHDVDQNAVAAYSPTLADRVAAFSTQGVDALVRQIVRVLGRDQDNPGDSRRGR